MVRFFFETNFSLKSQLDMIVLKELSTAQIFSCTPRESYFDTIEIKSEAENVITQITDFTINPTGYYINVEAIFDLREGFTYTLKLLSENRVVFFDKLFCTNQEIADFTVNENQYITRDSSNEFIII